jgi:hypothetical protein
MIDELTLAFTFEGSYLDRLDVVIQVDFQPRIAGQGGSDKAFPAIRATRRPPSFRVVWVDIAPDTVLIGDVKRRRRSTECALGVGFWAENFPIVDRSEVGRVEDAISVGLCRGERTMPLWLWSGRGHSDTEVSGNICRQ